MLDIVTSEGNMLILRMQIENEYGSFSSCDHAYMANLTYLVKSLIGDKVQLFTTDGNNLAMLKCGTTPGVFSTVDFGAG